VLVLAAAVTTGPLGAGILALFVLVGLGLAVAASRSGVAPRAVGATALLGLMTHPFGDLLTGEPPALLYPLDASLLTSRLTLHADPTINLLGAFWAELLVVWLAVVAACRLAGRRPTSFVEPRAAVGVGYAGAVLALPAPTLDSASQFVFSVLALGVVGPVATTRAASARVRGRLLPIRRLRRPGAVTAVVTGLAAVTCGAFAYTVTYLVL
jgi:membrane-bound metal-dependent hydrolase YbcI (DUF457 family)